MQCLLVGKSLTDTHMCVWSLIQSCPALCGPTEYSPPGSSVHGISQARTLEWVAISFSRGSYWPRDQNSSVQSLSHVRLCILMDCSTPGLPVPHQFLKLAQTYIHWVGDTIQPSHPPSSPPPPAFNLFQHQGLFQGVSSSHQVAKVWEFQLQHQSLQWIFRTDFL